MSYVSDVYERVKARDPQQPEFLQAVWEVLQSLDQVIARLLSQVRPNGA